MHGDNSIKGLQVSSESSIFMTSFAEFMIIPWPKMRRDMVYESYLLMLCLISIMCCTHALNSTFASSSKITCLPEQSSSLLKLKREFAFTKPDSDEEIHSYPKMKFWKAGKDCCEWDGVTCDMQTGQVVRLDLSNSWLQGPLSSNSSLFNLRQLQRLNLAFNDFNYSQIPSRFGQLSRLTHLNLSYSSFSGHVPSEIAWLNNLVSLDLSSSFNYDNENTALFLTMETLHENMTKLSELYLDQVNLSSLLPQSLSNLSSMTHLSLENCNLQGEFPSNIFLLPNIQVIDLTSNDMLTGFLPEFHSSSNLESLILFSTSFSGTLPNSIGNLKSLSTLDLGFCNFVGTIPSSIGNLSQLTLLDVQFNNLTGQLPPTLGNLSQLTVLSLMYSKFSGKLPSTLGNLSKLIYLFLETVGFSGELPSTLGKLRQLEYLDAVGNNVNGRIPSSLANLTRLTELYLHYNGFSGELIPGITNLTQLENFGISHNSLSGVIPSSLFTMPSLRKLQLEVNQFTGPLTIQNVSSSQLTSLSLSDNMLSGQIPRSISNLKSLASLSLASNNFSGTIELEVLSKLSNLSALFLSDNNLSVTYTNANFTLPKFVSLGLSSCNIGAEFPDFLRTQDKLEQLDMSDNKIEGKIPNWFLDIGIQTLSHLNLSHNSFTGWETAQSILPWNNLRILDLSSNMLQGSLVLPPLSIQYFLISENQMSGRIDPLFCNSSDLVVLDMSNNLLSGTIPPCLGSISIYLSVLSLKGNNFQGKLPRTFLDGNNLMTLDLSQNQLQGKIPQSLIKCRALEVLNLGHNQLSGTFPFWLQNLPELQVLVLRSNKFYGPIWHPHRFVGFEKLRIVDLSFNNFSGSLPSGYFRNWSAINTDVSSQNRSKLVYMANREGYYQDSVTVMNKGLEMVFVKILTIFTSIDLSHNNFHGEIPTTIGDLPSLIVLNLSSNHFEGLILSSLGNLKQLESLDLSNNKLVGRIPQQLASLTFLAYLNLSMNQLTGPIPQGGQFSTFPISSFVGNVELCGFPLSKKCGITDEQPTPDEEPESENGFSWKAVLVGYGCSFVLGAIGGNIVISKKPNWLVRIYGRRL